MSGWFLLFIASRAGRKWRNWEEIIQNEVSLGGLLTIKVTLHDVKSRQCDAIAVKTCVPWEEEVLFLHFLQCKWCCANGIMVSGPLFIFFSFAFFSKKRKSVSSRHPHGIRYWSRGLILTLTAAFILDNHGYLWSSLYLNDCWLLWKGQTNLGQWI